MALRPCAQRAIAEVKQSSQRSVIGWFTTNVLSGPLPCFGSNVKPLVPAEFVVVSTHQSALAPHGGLWPIRLIAEVKQRSQRPVIGWVLQMYYLDLFRALEVMLRWSRLNLHSLAPTNPHWARVLGSGPLSLCVIHKDSPCPNREDINRLMMLNIALILS
jgi:hypothetical protein